MLLQIIARGAMENQAQESLLKYWQSHAIDHKNHRSRLGHFGSTSSRSSYVEKKTCEFAVQPARIADIPWAIGAGLAEIGFTLESFTSSCSI